MTASKHNTPSDDVPPRDGWEPMSFPQSFTERAGPYYVRKAPNEPGIGFYARDHHLNLGGVVHGGALLSLADMGLWDVCRRKVGAFRGSTVTLNSEFAAPGKSGTFIETSGELVRAGRRLVVVRGLVTCEGETLLSYSGTLQIKRS